MATVILKKGGGRYLKSGGRWIYDNEIERTVGDFEPGDIVSVEDFDGYRMGKGYINPQSTITVRMLERYHDDESEDVRRDADEGHHKKGYRVCETGSSG